MTSAPWYIQHWIGLKDVATFTVITTSAVVGLFTYIRSARTRRAEALVALHKSFFVDGTYTVVRESLDDDSEKGYATREAMVAPPGPGPDLINFLNFFELVAYFTTLKAYQQNDIEALLGYYLRLLRRSGPVYRYICDKKNDFEHLNELLAKLDT
ncbi:MAG: hypothetical protein ACRYGF_11195 [Janthinobacterium lividum]